MILNHNIAKYLTFFASIIIASCANNKRLELPNSIETISSINKKQIKTEFRGRLALRIAQDPSQNLSENPAQPQSFSGSFELNGTALLGKLLLFSPLGTTLAALSWGPGMAQLDTGGATRQFESLDAMLLSATGTALPIGSLFSWLNGEPASSPDWAADVSQAANGRITARRARPAPEVELRVILD